jgi:hypothetical protein
MRTLSTIHDNTGRSLVWEIYPMRYLQYIWSIHYLLSTFLVKALLEFRPEPEPYLEGFGYVVFNSCKFNGFNNCTF